MIRKSGIAGRACIYAAFLVPLADPLQAGMMDSQPQRRTVQVIDSRLQGAGPADETGLVLKTELVAAALARFGLSKGQAERVRLVFADPETMRAIRDTLRDASITEVVKRCRLAALARKLQEHSAGTWESGASVMRSRLTSADRMSGSEEYAAAHRLVARQLCEERLLASGVGLDEARRTVAALSDRDLEAISGTQLLMVGGSGSDAVADIILYLCLFIILFPVFLVLCMGGGGGFNLGGFGK